MKNTAEQITIGQTTDQNFHADFGAWKKGKSAKECWEQCERADWMISLARGGNNDKIVKAVRECVARGQRFSVEGARIAVAAWVTSDLVWTENNTSATICASASAALWAVAVAAYHTSGAESWREEHIAMCSILRKMLDGTPAETPGRKPWRVRGGSMLPLSATERDSFSGAGGVKARGEGEENEYGAT